MRPITRRLLVAAAALVVCAAAPAQQNRTRNGGGEGGAAVPGEVLVKLQSASALQPLLAKYPLTVAATLGSRPIYRLKLVGSSSTAAVIAALRAEPGVEVAEPNLLNQAPEARKNIAWAIGTEVDYRLQWAPQAMHLGAAQLLSRGAGVTVAVLDTGVDAAHPALSGRLLPGRDWVDGDLDPGEVPGTAFGHGTHVAGLVALAAPQATILPLRVLGADGAGDLWSIAEAMVYAADPDGNPATDDGAKVINLSLGSLSRSALYDTIEQIVGCDAGVKPPADVSDPGYADDKLRCKTWKGAVVVAAAGNDASASAKEFPAALSASSLLSVAATDATNHIAAFSNYGDWIEVAAPGDHVTSAVPGGGYATWSGTSMAAPLVAGTAALVVAQNPGIAPKDTIARLLATSAAVCGTKLRQVDALAALLGKLPVKAGC